MEEAECGQVRVIPSQSQLGPPLSGPRCNRDLSQSSRPQRVRCLPSSVKSFRQTHFFWWPSFSGTDDTHTRPGCFAWHLARGWHSTPVTSLSLPLNTKQREGGSTRTRVIAGFQTVILFPLGRDGSTDCFSPQAFVFLTEGLLSFSQLGWNKWETSLPRGRGMADLTAGGPLLDKSPCL